MKDVYTALIELCDVREKVIVFRDAQKVFYRDEENYKSWLALVKATNALDKAIKISLEE